MQSNSTEQLMGLRWGLYKISIFLWRQQREISLTDEWRKGLGRKLIGEFLWPLIVIRSNGKLHARAGWPNFKVADKPRVGFTHIKARKWAERSKVSTRSNGISDLVLATAFFVRLFFRLKSCVIAKCLLITTRAKDYFLLRKKVHT